MAIKEFELFHGVLLTKLVERDRPIALRMIEAKPGEGWSAYTVNDVVGVLVKHSTNPRRLSRPKGARSWTFALGPNQLKQLRASEMWLAFICGTQPLDPGKIGVCLLSPVEVAKLVDLASNTRQSVSVQSSPGKAFRVSSKRADGVTVPRNRAEQWDVSG